MRKAPEDSPTVLSFGKVLADGATNVIPDNVILEGTFRTMNEEWRKEAHELIENLTSNIASAMGGSVEVEIRHGYPLLHNNEVITRESRRLATKLLGKAYVEDMEIRMTAEDFAWYTQSIPGMMYRLGVKKPGSETVLPLHTSRFQADESAIRTGISLMSFLAIEMLKMGAVEKINS